MAANGNVSVLVARCFLRYRSRLATVPHLLAPLAGQTGDGWRSADGPARSARPCNVSGQSMWRVYSSNVIRTPLAGLEEWATLA